MAKAKPSKKQPAPNKKPAPKNKPALKKQPAPKKPTAKKKPAPNKPAKQKPAVKSLAFAKLGKVPAIAFAQLPDRAYEVVYEPSKLKLRPFACPTRELSGHTQFVQALAFSPDGARLVSGSEDGTIRVWNVADGTCVATGTDHTSAVNFIAFTPDGELLSASDDGTVKRWTLPLACVQTFEGHTDYVSKVRAAGPGRAVSSSKDGTVRLWDFATGSELRRLDMGGWVLALGASSDGKVAAACNDRNLLQLWNLETGGVERVFYDASAGYIGEVMGMTVAADNRTGVGHASYPKVITFAPGDLTCFSAEKELIEWDVTTGAQLRSIEGDGWPLAGIAMIPDRAQVLREHGDPAERKFIADLERTPENRDVRTVYGDWLEDRGRLAEANSVRQHGAFRYVFAASKDAVHVLDLAMRTIVAQAAWSHGDLHNVAVSPDGRMAACGSEDGAVALWDVDALLAAGMPDRHLSRPSELAVSTEGIALTISTDRTARLWRRDGTSSTRLPAVDGLFAKARFARADLALVVSDSGVLAAYSPGGESRGVARFSEDKDSHSFSEHELLADGTLLSSSYSGPLAIWPLDPVAPPTKFAEEAGHVTTLAVDRASDTIFTAKYTSGKEPMQVRLWSLAKRAPIRELTWKPKQAQYVTSISVIDDVIALTTSEGGLVVCDRAGKVTWAIQLRADYILDAMVLPDGALVVYDEQPILVDVRARKVLGQLAFDAGDKAQYEFVHGTSRAIRYTDKGVELVDFANRTISARTPIAIRNATCSTKAEFVIGTALSDPIAGVPIVLRRLHF